MLTSSATTTAPTKELPKEIRSRTELPRGKIHLHPEGHALYLN